MKHPSLLSLGCLAALVACDPAAPTPAASSVTTSAPTTTATATATKPAPLKVSAPKDYKFTEAETLGTLPDGVGIAVGKTAPDFTLPAADGKELALKSVLAKGPALLVFYRGGW